MSHRYVCGFIVSDLISSVLVSTTITTPLYLIIFICFQKMKRPSAVDQELLYARNQIENPPMVENDPLLHGPLYWNLSMFKRYTI